MTIPLHCMDNKKLNNIQQVRLMKSLLDILKIGIWDLTQKDQPTRICVNALVNKNQVC